MEPNKPINPTPLTPSGDKPTMGSPGVGQSTGGEARRPGSTSSREFEEGSDVGRTAKEFRDRTAAAYDQTKQAVSEAYDKTSEVLSETYDQAMTYGRENPGKLTLIAFGAGIAVGLLLASTPRRSRTGRYAEPVVTALSDIALEFFRNR